MDTTRNVGVVLGRTSRVISQADINSLTFFTGENDLGKDIKRQGILDRNVHIEFPTTSLTTELSGPGEQQGRGRPDAGGAGGPREAAPAGPAPVQHSQLRPGSARGFLGPGDNY